MPILSGLSEALILIGKETSAAWPRFWGCGPQLQARFASLVSVGRGGKRQMCVAFRFALRKFGRRQLMAAQLANIPDTDAWIAMRPMLFATTSDSGHVSHGETTPILS